MTDGKLDAPQLASDTLEILQDLGISSIRLPGEESTEDSSEPEDNYEQSAIDHLAYYKAQFPERYTDSSVSATENPIALITVQDEYVHTLLIKAFRENYSNWTILTEIPDNDVKYAYHWGEYEDIEWFSGRAEEAVVSCLYNRKGLVRKALLAQTMEKYNLKKLNTDEAFTPRSHVLWITDTSEISHVIQSLDDAGFRVDSLNEGPWILKPSMTNQGKGISIVSTQAELVEAIQNSDEIAVAGGMVLQKYVDPFLIKRRKFHLRVFVLVVGDFKVYVFSDFLAIFSLENYDPKDFSNLQAHLTNIFHQKIKSKEEEYGCMRLFDEIADDLVDEGYCQSVDAAHLKLNSVKERVYEITRKTMQVVSSELTFQPRPNCFEIFGFDFLLDKNWHLYFLEANPEPDLSKAGDRLQPTIDRILNDTITLTVDASDRFPESLKSGKVESDTKYVRILSK